MGALAIALIGAGLFGGVAMIVSGSKKIIPITFPNSFYKDLKYFKKEGNKVIAVKLEGEDETLFNGDDAKVSMYFSQVQMGFEEWLKDNDHFSRSDSEVKFS